MCDPFIIDKVCVLGEGGLQCVFCHPPEIKLHHGDSDYIYCIPRGMFLNDELPYRLWILPGAAGESILYISNGDECNRTDMERAVTWRRRVLAVSSHQCDSVCVIVLPF